MYSTDNHISCNPDIVIGVEKAWFLHLYSKLFLVEGCELLFIDKNLTHILLIQNFGRNLMPHSQLFSRHDLCLTVLVLLLSFVVSRIALNIWHHCLNSCFDHVLKTFLCFTLRILCQVVITILIWCEWMAKFFQLIIIAIWTERISDFEIRGFKLITVCVSVAIWVSIIAWRWIFILITFDLNGLLVYDSKPPVLILGILLKSLL